MVKTAGGAPKRRDPKGQVQHSRSFKKTEVDLDLLSDELKDYIKTVGVNDAFDFFEYNSTWSSCAVRSKALAKNYEFVMALLRADASAAIGYTSLKMAVTNALLAKPEARISSDPIGDQAGVIAKRAIVIQTHLRRISTGQEADVAYEKCLLETASYPELAKKLQTMRQICHEMWNNSSKLAIEPYDPEKRQKIQDKDLQDYFFASDSESESESISEKPMHGLMSDFLDSDSGSDSAKPAVKAKPAMAKAKTKAKAKATGKSVGARPSEDDPKIDMKTVKLEGPFPSGKAYIRHKIDGKWKCLVYLEQKTCSKFGQVMKNVFKYIQKHPGIKKSAAVAEKDRLVNKK